MQKVPHQKTSAAMAQAPAWFDELLEADTNNHTEKNGVQRIWVRIDLGLGFRV